MRPLNKQLVAVALGATCSFVAPGVFAQDNGAQTVRLAPEQLLKVAVLSLQSRHYQRALAFADALLLRDDTDVDAHLVRSQALRGQGDYEAATSAAKAGLKRSTTDQQKYASSMLIAQALSSDGKRSRAQLWLRRAAQSAPTEKHAARAKRDFKYVRMQNPWQTNLSFTLAPNTNINNGSARDSSALLYQILNPFDVDGAGEVALGAASKALSGIEAGFNLQTRYRFHQTETTAHDLRFGMSYRTFKLSQSSLDDLAEEDAQTVADGGTARNITGSDFAYGTVQLGYGYKKLRKDKRGEFSFTADLGQSFYGGARYNHYLRGRIGQSYYKDARTKFDIGLSADLRTAGGESDQNRVSLSTGMSRKLAAGNGLYLGASVSTMNADAERLEYDELSLRSGYSLGRQVMGAQLQFGLSTSFRDYDVSPHDASGRRDFTVSAEVTATLRNVDYFGFNPTVSLTAGKTNSNIGLYDVNRVGLGIGIASSF